MDRTVWLIMALVIATVVGVILLFLVNSKSTDFSGELDGEREDARCGSLELRYENACDCSNPNIITSENQDIRQKAQNEGCDWTQPPTNCQIYCN